MNASLEEGKDLMLRMFAKQIALEHPSWGKAKCYAQAQSEHPELAECFSDSEEPAAASQGYRYDPAKPSVVSQVKLDELLKKYGSNKIEADKEENDGEPMLVYGSNGEELGTVYFD